MAVGDYALPLVLNERPRFRKRQIRCLSQIHKSQAIRICDDDRGTIAIVSRGPYKENGQWKLDLEFRKINRSWERTILLSDYSVIRDEDGNWITARWLEKA